jgi:hypothetical protein
MNTQSNSEALPLTTDSPSFERVRVTITEGAWKGEKGWITSPKNEVGANPITTDGGICLAWFDSEIRRENAGGMARELAAQDSDNSNDING